MTVALLAAAVAVVMVQRRPVAQPTTSNSVFNIMLEEDCEMVAMAAAEYPEATDDSVTVCVCAMQSVPSVIWHVVAQTAKQRRIPLQGADHD